MEKQQTIARPVSVEGRGLFGGEVCNLTFKPAEANSGVVFVRMDKPDPVRIAALVSCVVEQPRRTTLSSGNVSVETVEHCLAAVNGLQIDNLEVEIDSAELPNVGGSCQVYADALAEAGIHEQPEARVPLVITEPIIAQQGEQVLYALPNDGSELSVTYHLDYSNSDAPSIGRQLFCFRSSPDVFRRDIASARTFVTQNEAEQFRASGLGAHLKPGDVVVMGADGPVDTELLFADECVRHKVADLMGDIMLAGRGVRGRIVAYRSGHSCNQLLASKLLKQWEKQQRRQKLGSDALLDIRKIQKILPHRYPFLLVDRVIEIDGDKRAVGLKNVTMNEQFFQGHFPGTPIMPGVLIVEALAQMSGLLFAQKLEHTGQLAVLLSMDKVKIRRAVVPGDQLILDVEAVRVKRRMGDCRCRALVGDQVVAEAQIRFMLVDADPV